MTHSSAARSARIRCPELRAARRPRLPATVPWVASLALSLWAGAATAQDCDAWTAIFESVAGQVEIRATDDSDWLRIETGATACAGNTVRVGNYGRATLRLPDNTMLSLDANSYFTIEASLASESTLIRILRGIIHVISRDPRSLRFNTPYANAGLEGTEFDIEVDGEQMAVTVIEGEVLLTNAAGRLYVPSGQRGEATATAAPRAVDVSDRFERADWTPYFAPILARNLPAADAAPSPEQAGDARFFTGRAARRLSTGAIADARSDLQRAREIDPQNAEATALEAQIELIRADKAEALRLAQRAVELDSTAAGPLLALSYAQQAQSKLQAAATALSRAIALEPENPVAWARLAEIRLASGEYFGALGAANRALELDANLARAQTVLGFALLSQTDARAATTAFRRAIAMDSSSPLPRLGLGLALVRQGDVEQGRLETEVAVILDPQNAMMRSYMARIYAAQHRTALDETQLELARILDPNDYTPFLFDALSKQAANRPVEALHAYQKAVDLNDNRAPYRSTLRLEQDLAIQSSGIGKLHKDLGFEQLALLEGWKSTLDAPTSHAGHRLLSDVYSVLPRHEIARTNELFLAQMLQPINLTPIAPQLAEPNLFILDNAGPSDLSFNEFGRVLSQNGHAVQLSGTSAGNGTNGVDVSVAGLQDNVSYSLGYFEFETDGFRANNDLQQTVANAFVQYRLGPATSLQTELRSSSTNKGDLALRFDPEVFAASQRHDESVDMARLGFRHDLSGSSTLLGSLVYEDSALSLTTGSTFTLQGQGSGYTIELRHMYRRGDWQLNTGFRRFAQDQTELSTLSVTLPFPPFQIDEVNEVQANLEQSSLYAYWDYSFTRRLTTTLGLSVEQTDSPFHKQHTTNPKVGLLWEPDDKTTVRLSAFRTLQGPFVSRQDIQPRLEPTHVSGFNQYFFGSEGEEVWRFGAAIDRALSEALFAGLEFSRRDISRPTQAFLPDFSLIKLDQPIDEKFYRGYLYWAPAYRWSFAAEYEYEKIDGHGLPLPQGYIDATTHRLPLQLRLFHTRGLSTAFTATFVKQYGNFSPMTFGSADTAEYGEDNFLVYDLSLGYRLPRRRGALSVNIDNVFDESFRFQDLDPENPSIVPERMVSLRFTVSY